MQKLTADDLLSRAVQEQAPSNGDDIAKPQNAQLDVLPIYARAIGAFQVGEHELTHVFLNLDMEAADPFIVKLNGIAFLAADRDGRWQHFIDAAPIGPVQNS